VCTAIAFPLWFALIARVGAARAALVTYGSPVVSIALGVVLLGEQPGRLAPLGLALVLAGSWAASRSGGAARSQAAPARPLCDAGGVRLATHVSIHGSAPRS
jgi:drug/metabolite transporter (DMT)-like permease